MPLRRYLRGALFIIGLGVSCNAGWCAETNTPSASTPAQAVVRSNSRPPASTALGSTRPLSPNDQIAVTVFQEDDLSAKAVIDTNGVVILPLLGQVKVGSMTVPQATARIQELYNKDYLVNPRVNLTVERFAARHFSVLGEVQRPGNFDFPQNESVTLLQAIAMSGGYTRLGAPGKVTLLRLQNGAQKIYHLDAAEMLADTSRRSFEILPGDVITVGQRTF